ncbi:FecR family protein [Hymenobacter daecheongensis DSM 21074]|uniref:FecR family protein n=1 Tax=Hymenobacter daecheongensis DSM 21074 TaxID=1121955 RepID=A0A1M6A054_9BACT|nr:FecR domain-containing protein [Hymenobacter daecheongensis]SHI29897.1 FecR family protein [Hymenobacter daecheongensis DSM 21074]
MHPSNPEAPWELLARHLAGEATPGELEELRTWVVADPWRLGLLTDATRAWERVGAAPVPDLFSPADVEAAWQRFRPQMLGARPAPEAPQSPAAPPAKVVPMYPGAAARPWLLPVAATLLLLVGAVFFFRANQSSALAPVLVAATSQQRQLTLPDGSQVWLNRHSTLEYDADFRTAAREVKLSGEAFFQIQKDHGRPFTVLSETARTQVLGTSFNVRAYPAEDSVEVAVLTGRVALASRTTEQDTLLLLPGMRGVLRAAGNTAGPTTAAAPTLRRASTQDTNFRAWQTGELVFDNVPVRHVIRTLRTTFGTSISVADTRLLSCRFTGTFRRPEPAQVLQVLSLATNATLTGDAGNGYILGGKGCD